MYTIDLSHIVPSKEATYVLRLRNRADAGSRSMKVRAGSIGVLPDDALPGLPSQLVVWVDEVYRDGTSKPLTSRFRLDSLKGVARLEQWLREPTRMATQEEAVRMLATLDAWEYFGDTRLRERLTRLVKDVSRRIRRKRVIPINSRVALLCRLYQEKPCLPKSLPANVMVSLMANLELHEIIQKNPIATGRNVEHVSQFSSPSVSPSLREDLRNVALATSQYSSASAPSHLLRGQILSVIEGRAAALGEFHTALSSDPDFIRSLYLDLGAFTYGIPESNSIRTQLNIVWHGGSATDSTKPTILYSANVDFLRRYLTRIVFYAVTEPELQLHFHIVASEKEASSFIREADELVKTIHKFSRRVSKIPSLSWSSSTMPPGVGNQITYYACARYLVAQQVMQKFGTDVWIQDVDLFPVSPISESAKKFEEFDVVIAVSTGLNMIAPWRRYLAGNVYLSRSDEGRQFAANVEDYLWAFLDRPDSWMLDQNALDWAVENAPVDTAIGNMSVLGVGLTQSHMNGTIES